mgnify:CR=1 FL=1
MPSTNKTSLGLNHWEPNDVPAFDDFNADNMLVDSELSKRAALSTPTATNWDSGNLRIEEGEWSPTMYGTSAAGNPTYTTRNGHYLRLGKWCLLRFSIQVAAGHGMAGSLRIGGLPFSTPGNEQHYTGSIAYGTGLSLPTGTIFNTFVAVMNAFWLVKHGNTGAADIQASDFPGVINVAHGSVVMKINA